jgi:hypothetical protein
MSDGTVGRLPESANVGSDAVYRASWMFEKSEQ